MLGKNKYKYLSLQGPNEDIALSAIVSAEHHNYTLPAMAKANKAKDTGYLRYLSTTI